MNKKGVFGFAITIVILLMMLWVWAIIQPDITPTIQDSIDSTSDAAHADGIEFFLRMVPWMVPLIFIVGLLWVGANR